MFLSADQCKIYPDLVLDYYSSKDHLKDYYSVAPDLENFQKLIAEHNFSSANRKVLTDSLILQYKGFSTDSAVQNNISLLESESTFTITTGHQLCLFGGPSYFIYKIVSAIKLCQDLKLKYPENDFVPVYWMASEDHDFEEVKSTYLFKTDIVWDEEYSDKPVGQIEIDTIKSALNTFEDKLGTSERAEELKQIFQIEDAKTLAEYTRQWVNKVFGKYGLVIIDADQTELKKQLIPAIKKDFFEQVGQNHLVSNATAGFENYKLPINSREINFFHIKEGKRKRWEREGEHYFSNSSGIKYSKSEIERLIDEAPEEFSPNVIFRPVYQELILPNLAYLGGPSEIAYWLQLKPVFDQLKVAFPMLLARDSFLLLAEKSERKLNEFGLNFSDLFNPADLSVAKYVSSVAEFEIEKYQNSMLDIFSKLENEVKSIDGSLVGFIGSEKAKLNKALEGIQKRIQKSVKQKEEVSIRQIQKLFNEVYPENVMQERLVNFSEFYLKSENNFINLLLSKAYPLNLGVEVIVLTH